jgi:hypothetical protein
MKATKAQAKSRVEEILRIRLDGAEIWDVREYVREKEREEGSPWHLAEGQKPLSDSQLWRYMAAADKLIAESCRASRKKLLRRHLAQRRNLYAKAVSQGDVRAALAVLRDEAELLRLYPSRNLQLTGKGGAPIYPPLEAIVAALIEAERSGGQGNADTQGPRSEPGDSAAAAGSERLP